MLIVSLEPACAAVALQGEADLLQKAHMLINTEVSNIDVTSVKDCAEPLLWIAQPDAMQ